MMSDKKRIKKELHYVLLSKIGKAVIQPLTLEEVREALPQP